MGKCKFSKANNKTINIEPEDFPWFISTTRYAIMKKDSDPYCDCAHCWRRKWNNNDRSWKNYRRTQWRDAITAIGKAPFTRGSHTPPTMVQCADQGNTMCTFVDRTALTSTTTPAGRVHEDQANN